MDSKYEESLVDPLVSKRKTDWSSSWKNNPKVRYISIGIASLLVAVGVITIAVTFSLANRKEPTNIIFMISDGYGPPSQTMARVCSGRDRLTLDSIHVGTVRTYSSDSWVTDSAAGATAYACGVKTYNNAIGVDANQKPCGTTMEAAKAKGMRTGIVVTDAVAGATPGAFSSHAVKRSMYEFIAKQQIDHGIDVIFGGGLNYYINRQDGINLTDYAKARGYQVVTDIRDFYGDLQMPVVALLANNQFSFDIDRDPKVQPSLAQMAQRALDILSGSQNGFFLMVEGSLIDIAGHQNDPAANYREALAYDAAVDVILNFANARKKTIVISTSDHETGGLTLGINNKYNGDAQYFWHPEILRAVKCSASKMASLINSGQSVSDVLSQYANLSLTPDEIQAIQNVSSVPSKAAIVIGNTISYYASIGWSTLGHTGVDVNLYASGYKSDDLRGNYNNIDIGNWVAQTFGLDLAAETEKLKDFSPFG